MASPEIMRTEFAVIDEDGDALEWFDDLDAAIDHASGLDAPVLIQRTDEYYPEKSIVWASHASMVEVDQ